jgi:G protein-coupled receptor 158
MSRYDEDGAYECLLCPYGCDTCVDDRPCVVSLNWLMRSAILILQCVIILMLPIVGLFTWKYSEVKVRSTYGILKLRIDNTEILVRVFHR